MEIEKTKVRSMLFRGGLRDKGIVEILQDPNRGELVLNATKKVFIGRG